LFDKADGGILRYISKTFDCRNGFGWIHLKVIHRFAHGIDHTIAGGFGAAF
jgi:hypothetical protein